MFTVLWIYVFVLDMISLDHASISLSPCNSIYHIYLPLSLKLPMIGCRADDVTKFLTSSLKKLQLSYVDLYLVHFPAGLKGTLGRRECVFNLYWRFLFIYFPFFIFCLYLLDGNCSRRDTWVTYFLRFSLGPFKIVEV